MITGPVRILMTVRMRSIKMFTMIVRMMKRQDGQRDIALVSITYFDSHLLEESFRKCVNLEIRNCTFFLNQKL